MKIDQTLEEQIRFLEEYLLKPEVRTSPLELGNILADDFIEYGSSGRVYDKQQVIKALQVETGVNISLMEFKLILLCHGVVLATYRTIHYSEAEVGLRYALRSSIWKHDEGCWKMVFHQGTPIDANISDEFKKGYNKDQD